MSYCPGCPKYGDGTRPATDCCTGCKPLDAMTPVPLVSVLPGNRAQRRRQASQMKRQARAV